VLAVADLVGNHDGYLVLVVIHELNGAGVHRDVVAKITVGVEIGMVVDEEGISGTVDPFPFIHACHDAVRDSSE
jgi:hypothetical protein